MTFIPKSQFNSKLVIDLSGPEGNAFVLLGYVNSLAKPLGLDVKKIQDEMTSSDYNHLLQVFESYFGNQVVLLT